MFSLLGKFIFIGVLLGIFLKLFGYPSYIKYTDGEALISEATVKFDAKMIPAVTIIGLHPKNDNGWKNLSAMNYGFFVDSFCKDAIDSEDVQQCIYNDTFKLTDMVEYASYGDGNTTNIEDSRSFWIEDISVFLLGRSYTLNNSYEVGSDYEHRLMLTLDNSLHYYIVIHDPNYFLMAVNPKAIPKIILFVDDEKPTRYTVYIQATYHQMMNKPTRPCETAGSYSFTACVKNSVSRKVGCRMEWDLWVDRDIPACKKMEEIRKLDQEFYQLHSWDQAGVMNYTGCLRPCSYTEYQLATKPLKKGSPKTIIRIMMASLDVLRKKEQTIYTFESFVSEFGGALGLFLGFSFMMIWEVLEGIGKRLGTFWHKND